MLNLDELKLGDLVKVSQIEHIVGVHIILLNCEILGDGEDLQGEVGFIGEERTEEFNKLSFMDNTYNHYNEFPLEDNTYMCLGDDGNWRDCL